MMIDDMDLTREEQLERDLEFIGKMERGDTYHIISKATHPSWYAFALLYNRVVFVSKFLDAHDVPQFDCLKQRVAYYQLLGAMPDE